MTDTLTVAHPRSPSRKRGPFVIAMMVMAGLLFFATAGILYYQWATTVEPNCVLIVNATPVLRGAEVTVDGMMLPKAHSAVFGDEGRYSLVFFLDPGKYDVKVVLDGQIQYAVAVHMQRMTQATLDLTHVKPTSQP